MRAGTRLGVVAFAATLLAATPAAAHVPRHCMDEAAEMANLATLAGAAARAAERAGARGDHAMAEELTLQFLEVQADFVEQVDETWRCIAR